jgi:hypothetical protein
MAMTLTLGSAHTVLADSCSMGRTPDGVYPVNDASWATMYIFVPQTDTTEQ